MFWWVTPGWGGGGVSLVDDLFTALSHNVKIYRCVQCDGKPPHRRSKCLMGNVGSMCFIENRQKQTCDKIVLSLKPPWSSAFHGNDSQKSKWMKCSDLMTYLQVIIFLDSVFWSKKRLTTGSGPRTAICSCLHWTQVSETSNNRTQTLEP